VFILQGGGRGESESEESEERIERRIRPQDKHPAKDVTISCIRYIRPWELAFSSALRYLNRVLNCMRIGLI